MAANSAASLMVKLQKLSNQATEKSFKYNTQEANTARTWQKMMSDTSHQREVKDLQAAGLNPVLSAGGQGAQSYTTSSASGQAENPSSAIANVYGADVSAQATRAAAAQSAAAQRYAAQQAAAAQRYAAMMQYESTKYAWDTKTQQIKDEYKYKEHLALKTPAHNLFSLIDKYAERTRMSDVAVGSNVMKGVRNFVKGVLNDPMKLFKENVKATTNDYNKFMTAAGKSQINTYLKQFGIARTDLNRNRFVRAFIYGSNPNFGILLRLMPKKKANSARNVKDNKYNAHLNLKYGKMTV